MENYQVLIVMKISFFYLFILCNEGGENPEHTSCLILTFKAGTGGDELRLALLLAAAIA